MPFLVKSTAETARKAYRTSGEGIFSALLLACVPVLSYNQGIPAKFGIGIANPPYYTKMSSTRSQENIACFFVSNYAQKTAISSMGRLCGADESQVAVSSFGAIFANSYNLLPFILIANGMLGSLTNQLKEQAMNTPYIRDTPPKNRFHLQNSILSLFGIIAALQTLSETKQDFQDNFIVLTNLFQAAHELLEQLERQVGCLPEFVTGEA